MSDLVINVGLSASGNDENSNDITPTSDTDGRIKQVLSNASSTHTASTQVVDNTHAVSAVSALNKRPPKTPRSSLPMDRQRSQKAAQQLMGRLVDPPARTSPTSLQSDSLRARRNRRRNGGGAYAKLLLSGKAKLQKENENNIEPAEQVEENDPNSVEEVDEEQQQQDELNEIINTSLASIEMDEKRKQAINEFKIGTEKNSRYHPSARFRKILGEKLNESNDTADDISCASLPSVLNRSEIFHEDATAAVLALLTPRSRRMSSNSKLNDGLSVKTERSTLDEAGLVVSPSQKGLMLSPSNNATTVNIQNSLNDSMSVASNFSNSLDTTILIPTDEPILSLDAERALNVFMERMREPSKSLGDLLITVATPDDTSKMDRAFMVRRKNACGAIKVLTANPKNRRTLCWTTGVLSALTSVLDDTGESSLKDAFPNPRTRTEYIEARKRAVSALINLVIPKENRIPAFHSPGLIQAAAKVIVEDNSESRQGCCTLLTYLAKTKENRILMAQVPGLLHAMTTVIAPANSKVKVPQKNNMYTWDDETGEGNNFLNSHSTEDYDLSMQSSSQDPNREEKDKFAFNLTIPETTSTLVTMQKRVDEYDKDPNQFLHGARSSIFAIFLHLVKEKDCTYILAKNNFLMETLVNIATLHGSPSHVHAVKIIANLTRHPSNTKDLVFKVNNILPAMVFGTKSRNNSARLHAIYTIQNLSVDRSCRQEVSNTHDLIISLCQRARQAKQHEEQVAAISALKNLTDDPANLIPMSNTPECFATLMQIAHGGEECIQYIACDALTTLSHWLRKIATSGSVENGQPTTTTENTLFVPSLKVVPFNQWS